MVILFDGVCNLCNGFVKFVIKHDKQNRFQFASLQSNYGIELMNYFHLDSNNLETVLLFNGNKIYNKSDAVIHIINSFGGLWKTVVIFRMLPKFLRNYFYDLIARQRNTLFGTSESCMVPDDKYNNKFIDDSDFIPLK
jgi:predicted DCC family thiol-disulfide oxidoreductase YuxK